MGPSHRRQSRELAMQLLFQREFAPMIPVTEFVRLFETHFSEEIIGYSVLLFEGVSQQISEIDASLSSTARNWKIERMSSVDRNILRIAVFEMKYAKDPIKPEIVINEAIEIAKKYGTTDSSGFVNGILHQVAQNLGAQTK